MQRRRLPPSSRCPSTGCGRFADSWFSVTRYNYERFSLALQGRTPAEKLAAVLSPSHAA